LWWLDGFWRDGRLIAIRQPAARADREANQPNPVDHNRSIRGKRASPVINRNRLVSAQ
jgi:hypothetical protein